MSADGIGILGAGRQALETSQYCRDLGLRTVFFLEEQPPSYQRDLSTYGAPVLGFNDDLTAYGAIAVVTAVGAADVRRRFVERWPGQRYTTLVAPSAWQATDVVIGAGSTVAPLASLNRCASVGEHVLVNVGAIVSHDVTLGDFSTISPGVAIGGGCHVGADVFVGIGATVVDHVEIGRGAFIAAGAVVVANVGAHERVMGVPARKVGP